MAEEEHFGVDELDADAERALALELQDELSTEEADWFEAYKATHDRPPRNEVWVGRGKDEDLGVFMGGWDEWGEKWLVERGTSNVNIAGGWCFRVGTLHDDRGWFLGWGAELSGLSSFLDAMGLDPVEDADGLLGPLPEFKGGMNSAYYALAKRLLATLVIVSSAALDAHPASTLARKRQEAQFRARYPEPSAPPDDF